MSLLTVDVGGANQTVIPFARAGHAEPRQVGKRRYAFAGNERSMIRAEPMVIPLAGANLPAATVKTLRSIFATGAQVYCAGDVFNNGGLSVLCSGEIADEMEQGGTYWIPTLTLHEVTANTGGTFGLTASVGGVGSASMTLIGPRRGTISVAGVGSVSIAAIRWRSLTVASVAGVAATSLTLARVRALTISSASGVGSVSVTMTKIP